MSEQAAWLLFGVKDGKKPEDVARDIWEVQLKDPDNKPPKWWVVRADVVDGLASPYHIVVPVIAESKDQMEKTIIPEIEKKVQGVGEHKILLVTHHEPPDKHTGYKPEGLEGDERPNNAWG
jgi:hypothetical protein